MGVWLENDGPYKMLFSSPSSDTVLQTAPTFQVGFQAAERGYSVKLGSNASLNFRPKSRHGWQNILERSMSRSLQEGAWTSLAVGVPRPLSNPSTTALSNARQFLHMLHHKDLPMQKLCTHQL